MKTIFQFRFVVDASAPNFMQRPLIFVNLTTVTMTFMHAFNLLGIRHLAAY